MGAHARLLAEAGHDVVLVAGRGAARVVPEIDSRHPRVEELTAGLAAGEDMSRSLELLVHDIAGALVPLTADRDLVIVHNAMTMPLNLALTASLLRLGRPLLAWTHDLAVVNPRYRAFRRARVPYSLISRAQPGVRYVTVSGTRAAELATAFGLPRREVAVVPNGIDPPAFMGLGGALRRLARRAGFEEADPLVLVPVRVTPRKRIELAIEAAARLLPAYPGLRVVVTGPLGPHDARNSAYQDRLDALVERTATRGAVVFCHRHGRGTGDHPVDGEMMAQLYRRADVVLLPSESEGFGLPVLEAGVARTPIVCADIPILREVGGAGPVRFLPGGGPEAVAEALSRALGSRPARMRSRVMRTRSWEVIRPAIEAAIEDSIV